MKRNPPPAITLLATLFLSGAAAAAIINVPGDQATIELAIENSWNGDTILVHPGEYRELVTFTTRTLASLALTTGDDAYIDSTIINGEQQGTVVTIPDGGGGTVIYGLTISNGESSQGYGGGLILSDPDALATKLSLQNNHAIAGGGAFVSGQGATISNSAFLENSAESGGGAICCYGSGIILNNLILTGNSAVYGGGIYQSGADSVLLFNSVISENYASYLGGGIATGSGGIIMDSVLVLNNRTGSEGAALAFFPAGVAHLLRRTQITGNSSDADGSAVYLERAALTLENVTMADNYAAGGFFGIYSNNNASLTAVNSILWANDEPLGGWFQLLAFSYCDLEGGEQVVEDVPADQRAWGEGNLDDDPEFADPAEGDYRLSESSPCLDAGDPTNRDPDGTRPELGAWHYPQPIALLSGFVYDYGDLTPLPAAALTSSLGQRAESGADGYYQFSPAWTGPQQITVSLPGFNTILTDEFTLAVGDTQAMDFSLHHPGIVLSEDAISESIPPDDSLLTELILYNDGNGLLEWSAGLHLLGEAYLPWHLRHSLDLSAVLDDWGLQGVAFAAENLFVSGSAGDTNFVYILNRDGELQARFPQASDDVTGLRDLAWDGEWLWGVAGNTAYAYNLNGDLIKEWTDRRIQNSAITWDLANQLLWTASFTDDQILGFDMEGNLVESLAGVQYTAGLAYWRTDPDGFPLYLYCNTGLNDSRQLVYKIDPARDSLRFVSELLPPGGGAPSGAEITAALYPDGWELMTLVNDGRHDRLDVWHLASFLDWISFAPLEGTLAPENEAPLTLSLYSVGLDTGRWEGEILFNHNAAGETLHLPVTMRVTINSISDFAIRNSQFALGEAYPNPFNSSFTFSYQLSAVGPVSLFLYDVSGRLVSNQQLGIGNPGSHRAVINGEALVSGVYFLKLTAGNKIAARKIVCVK